VTETPIILLGPLGVGKSTIAAKLSSALGLPRCCYDEIKSGYLEGAGFELRQAHRIRDTKGMYEMCMYTNQFAVEVLERVLGEHPGHVIDLGAGSYCFEEAWQVSRAKEMFRSIKNSILLMPSADLATCILTLPGVRERRYMNTYFIMHPLNLALARHTLYTSGKTPELTTTEAIELIHAGT